MKKYQQQKIHDYIAKVKFLGKLNNFCAVFISYKEYAIDIPYL